MTIVTIGGDAVKITKLLSNEFPALDPVVWDLSPFIRHMHYLRKNIVFVECDRLAVESVAEKLAIVFSKMDVYAGVKKPVLKFGSGAKEVSVVIVAREGKNRREMDGGNPKLEKCLVDLLYYAKNEVLPLPLVDVLDLWEFYLTTEGLVRFNELYRYSMRRYLGWFVSIYAYSLSKDLKTKVDSRHLRAGLKNLELIRRVVSGEGFKIA